jgi:hypothetical protein
MVFGSWRAREWSRGTHFFFKMCSFLLRIRKTYFYRERWLAWGDMGVDR